MPRKSTVVTKQQQTCLPTEMFSKDNLKRLAEQAQKAGTRLATNAGGTTNQWFAGQGSPERNPGKYTPTDLSSASCKCSTLVQQAEQQNCQLIFSAGDVLEGLSELPPEQAVVKLQRQNARLRRKAEAAMALEQENAGLKSQLEDLAAQVVRLCMLLCVISKVYVPLLAICQLCRPPR